LSKIWGASKSKLGEVQRLVITDECIGVSQLLGGEHPAAPKVYAYAYSLSNVPIQSSAYLSEIDIAYITST